MRIRRNLFTVSILATVSILSFIGLSPRWLAEKEHRQFGLVVETTEVQNLARQAGLVTLSLMRELKEQGIEGVAVNELSGFDLSGGQSGFLYGPLVRFPGLSSLFPSKTEGDLAVVAISGKKTWNKEAAAYLKTKFPGLLSASKAGTDYFLLPRSVSELEKAGVVADFEGLNLARETGMPVLFRPVPCPGAGADRVVASLDSLLKTRPEIKGILPQGLFIMGSPEIGRVGEWIREKGLFLAQAEFNRQLGADKLNRFSYPALVPIHSVTTDEVIVKRLSRGAIVERFVRASVERSVPLLLLRSYEIDTGGRKQAFMEDLSKIKKDLEGRGFKAGWPAPFVDWPRPASGAIAFGLVSALFFARLFLRFRGKLGESTSGGEAIFVVVGGLLLAPLMLKVSFAARLAGAAGSVLVATETTLWTLGEFRKPLKGLVGGLLLTVTGGLALAAFFSTPQTMLRLQPFSGVKATLLLPPLFVLAHDLKRRIYPEDFREVLFRPMVWIEFLLVCLVLVAAGILALRSDNTAFVGGWERTLRDLLERTLVARPRTKELFIGYPALILWYAMARKNWGRHAWILPRAAASIGIASAVNSFCHFHTRLLFILFRVFNGWWSGVLVGFSLLVFLRYAALPLARKWRSALWT
jgi:hypothetical protein